LGGYEDEKDESLSEYVPEVEEMEVIPTPLIDSLPNAMPDPLPDIDDEGETCFQVPDKSTIHLEVSLATWAQLPQLIRKVL
jgi:hypothetical protein